MLQGDLLFFVNGVSQGVAASSLPTTVFAVIDMYGKCAQVGEILHCNLYITVQVSLMDNSVQEARIHSNDLSNVATAAAAATTHLNSLTVNNSHNNITNTNIQVNVIHNNITKTKLQAATAAASAAVSLATQSGIAIASASGLIQGGLGAHTSGYNNNKIR